MNLGFYTVNNDETIVMSCTIIFQMINNDCWDVILLMNHNLNRHYPTYDDHRQPNFFFPNHNWISNINIQYSAIMVEIFLGIVQHIHHTNIMSSKCIEPFYFIQIVVDQIWIYENFPIWWHENSTINNNQINVIYSVVIFKWRKQIIRFRCNQRYKLIN